MSDNLIPINILIGDRTYRIKTSPQDEEMIRAGVKTINDKITEFKTAFSGKDMQDYIAMAFIWYATQINSGQQQRDASNADLGAVLARIEQQLDKVL